MSEFVIQTPSEYSNSTQSITASVDDEYITLSDTEYGSQYITIPLDKWQELKERIDSTVPPINPKTGKPYFETRGDAWRGEWVAGEVKPIPNSEFGGCHE